MDTKDVQCLLTIAELKSFSRAAEKLYHSQPYLSRYVSNVEKELGFRIFDRSTSPLQITRDGEVYLEYIRTVKQLEENVLQSIKTSHPERCLKIRIGITPIKGSYILPNILPVLLGKYPGAGISIVEGTVTELEDELYRENVDVAIFSQPTFLDGITYNNIKDDRVILTVPRGHPLYREDCKNAITQLPVPASELKQQAFILSSKSTGMRRIVDRIFADLNITPKIILETQNFEAAYRFSMNGLGLTFVPEFCTMHSVQANSANYFTVGSPPYFLRMTAAYKSTNPLIEEVISLTREYLCADEK